MYTTIKTLWERGRNKTEISKMTGHDWKTVNKIIKRIESGKDYPEKKDHPSKLDNHKDQILEWLEHGLTGIRIFEELKKTGLQIGYSTIKDYLSKIKKRQKIFIRVHTEPGEEAQVDFGYAGYTLENNTKRRKTWVFNMRLSYSRLDYYEKVYDQKVETFVQCHINAFEAFGGVPRFVKIDNLKAAILEANFYEPVYQELYKNFAEHYNFKIQPCRVRHPNDKGKVESGIKYVKNNFFLGRSFENSNDLDKRLKIWTQKANNRTHGTTRKIPIEIFEQLEKKELLFLPQEAFRQPKVGTRRVCHDCHIFVEYNYYSVPFEYVGKDVEIELDSRLLRIFHNNKEIAKHAKLQGKGVFSTENAHYPKYKVYSDTEYQEKYQIKMAEIGEFAEHFFLFLIRQNPNCWGRVIKGILSLVKNYSNEVINLACKRAIAYDVHTYKMVKSICETGSYKLPVEFSKEELAA